MLAICALCLLAAAPVANFGVEVHMRRSRIIKAFVLYRVLRKLPLFPLIPIAPAALVFGSLFASLRALARVKRLEQRLPAAAT